MSQTEAPFLALRDRAVALLESASSVSEDELLVHVFGGQPPDVLRSRFLEPLLRDPRVQRLPDGRWTLPTQGTQRVPLLDVAFTALAVTTTGPRPTRARVLRIAALHTEDGHAAERFRALLNPTVRVPRYVLDRAGIDAEVLNDLPEFASVADALEQFLAAQPIAAQDAQLTWAFLRAEARRLGRTLPEPRLLDVNDLASSLLELGGKPTLGVVARQLGISFTRLEDADEEARVLSLVVRALLNRAAERGLTELGDLPRHAPHRAAPLRRGATARELPDEPGIYVMHDAERQPLYVGKARRLRSRVASYVHRPLGATRRLEGLSSAVRAVDAQTCETDLEALVLEEREIRRLQPRFNTVRQQRMPRLWIRLPEQPVDPKRAPARLELSSGPEAGAGDYLGPFRNEALADEARALARVVFDLDRVRGTDRVRYVEQVQRAWAFLNGFTDEALAEARRRHADAVAQQDARAALAWEQRLRLVAHYDPQAVLLPADPRKARYAVLRPGPLGLEGFVIDRGVLIGFRLLEDGDYDALLQQDEPRTTPGDSHVVLRWLGAQRPTARLILLPDDAASASDVLAEAIAQQCS